MAYPEKYKILENEYPKILDSFTTNVVREKIAHSFPFIQHQIHNHEQLNIALDIIEQKAIELWNNNNNDFIEYCANYIDIALILPLSENKIETIFQILKIVSFGYLGENWQQIKKYLSENQEISIFNHNIFENPAKWNEYLFKQIYLAIFHLIRKKTWKDLSKATEIINLLREQQKINEKDFLFGIESVSERKAVALDLASLYHLAKAVELISTYQNEGLPNDINEKLDFHFENAQKYCIKAKNIELDLLLKYLHPTFKKLVANSIWTVAKGINSRVTKFVQSITKANTPVFELLYPQKHAVKSGLLDPAKEAIVVNLPTSSGKTLIAEFRILQALNQFPESWIVYAVPTRALVNQIYIRLKKDLAQPPLSLKIEKMSGALEFDAFEENIVSEKSDFNILITTYEKLGLLIRQDAEKKLGRPLSLVIVDEAHNIEEKSRGLRLELMLSTIKKDISNANYLLLTPEIPNAAEIGKWLSEERSNSISIELNWQPNERMIGEIKAEGKGRRIKTLFTPIVTTKNTISINEDILIKEYKKCSYTKSNLNSKLNLTSLVASDFDTIGGVLVIVDQPRYTYEVADKIFNILDNSYTLHDDVLLVKKYIASELGTNFPLVKLLDKGIGVHSSALPDEIKILIEQLMEAGHLKYLVATTTIAQGINFPVTAMFLASYNYPSKYGTYEMPSKDFWNLAGRAGRIGQKSIGTIGIAVRNDDDSNKLKSFVLQKTNDLISVLVSMIDDLDTLGEDLNLGKLYNKPEWSDFLQYISHLYLQAKNLDEFLGEIELTLRRTFGYKNLPQSKKEKLTESVKEYAKTINKGHAKLSDSTGFSTETIKSTIMQLKDIKIKREDWKQDNLFSQKTGTLQKLVGIMLNTPEIKESIEKINTFDNSIDKNSISKIIHDWVSGMSIEQISKKYYNGEISKCTRAIYSDIVNNATWGIASMQRLSGIDFESLSVTERRQLKNLPSMIYYGVNSEEAVLLRKENVPRTIANKFGTELKTEFGSEALSKSSSEITNWLKEHNWQNVIPANQQISSNEYKMIWKRLAGIE